MSDKNKRNLSLTDLDFHMDLDIENENRDKENQEKLEGDKQNKMGNTLDYYRDEMATKEVERMLQNIKEEPADEPEEEKSGEVKQAQPHLTSDTGSIDYEYMLSLLRESKKSETASAEAHEKAEHKTQARASKRREEELKAFKIFRVSAFVIFALFLIGFAALAFSMNKANKEIAVFKTDVEKLKEDNADYEKLKIEAEGLKQENKTLEEENAGLKSRLEQGGGGTPAAGEGGAAASEEGESQPAESGPTTYTVASGDSFWRISQRFYGDGSLYTEIKAANNIVNDSDIYAGMELIIPER